MMHTQGADLTNGIISSGVAWRYTSDLTILPSPLIVRRESPRISILAFVAFWPSTGRLFVPVARHWMIA